MMSSGNPQHGDLECVHAWFEEKGFRLDIRESDDAFWADLISVATQQVLAPKYGYGDSPLAAARRAQERFGQEQ